MSVPTIGHDFLGVMVAGQCFGIPVARTRDVLGPQVLTPVPLAPPAIVGLLNLRGRVITAIDLRTRLGMAEADLASDKNIVVVEAGPELYALVVDAVADVMSLAVDAFEPVPAGLDPLWRAVAAAVYPTECGLVVLLDIEKLLDSNLLSTGAALSVAS